MGALAVLSVLSVLAVYPPPVAADDAGLDPAELAWALLQRGDQEQAMVEATVLLAGDAPAARAAVVLGEALPEPREDGTVDEPRLTLPEPLAGMLADEDLRGHALAARGALWLRTGRPDLAEADLRAAAVAAERRGDEELRLVAAEQIALARLALNRLEDALDAALDALQRSRALERPVAEVHAHLVLGRILIRQRRVGEAEEHLTLARDGAVRLDLPRWEGLAEIALSILSRFRLDLDGALAHREAALDAYRRGDDLSGQARALHYIATIRIFRGELTAAMGQLLEAADLARAAGNDAELSGCLGDMAGINYLLGDLEQARTQYEEAIRLTRHPQRQGLWRINLGSILTHEERHEEALAVYREALTALQEVGDHDNGAMARLSIGRSLVELGRVEEGLQQLDEALAVARSREATETEAQVLRFYGYGQAHQGELTAAAATLAQATALARRTGNYQILEASLVTEAGVAKTRGRLEEAQRLIDEALRVVNDVRRRSEGAAAVQSAVFSEAWETYGLAIDLLYLQHLRSPEGGHDERAFDLAQRAKARAFLDMLGEAEVDLRTRADAGYLEREAAILAAIADLDARGEAAPDSAAILGARIASLEDELDLLEADIRAADPRYAAVRYPRPVDLASARRLLAADEALVEFALGDSASYVWAVTDRDFAFAALPPRRELEERIRGMLPLLQDPNLTGGDPAYYAPDAAALWRLLAGPVAPVIAGRERLVIAPDGILHYLPFEALLLREPTRGESGGFARLPWVRDAHVVSYVPSVSVLHHLRESAAHAEASRVLLVGEPVTGAPGQASVVLRAAGGEGLRPLAAAAEEMAAIEAVVGSEGLVTLGGARASAARLREAAGGAPFASVHFVLHGLFNEDRPQFSGLLLSPDLATGDDGFLTTGEVFALDLPCRQVVLSACSTALGRRVDGEGLVGLTRAFFFAGAQRVVSSLWDVSDASTALLMGEFYRRQAGGEDAAAALAGAKRLLGGSAADTDHGERYAHPFYWAGFVLSGVGREAR